MLIALLALLGVDLLVIVIVVIVLLTRRRWVSRRRDAFRGAIRVIHGEVSGLGSRWKPGYGRWVRDVLVWTKAPFLLRNELVAVDGIAARPRVAEPGEVKRIGRDPMIVQLNVDGGARVEVAMGDDLALGVGWRFSVDGEDDMASVHAEGGGASDDEPGPATRS